MTTFQLFMAMVLAASLTSTTAAAISPKISTKKRAPNIVFLVCESTDGRTWREGYQNSVIPLPNLRSLEQDPGGHGFYRHYSNTPVCCPSRATLWSGRHAHKIPHIQRQSHYNKSTNQTKIRKLLVNGVWNNYEGLPPDFEERIDQVLQHKAGYATHLSGKLDFTTGGHSENVKLSAWTMYTRFPYNLHTTRGWAEEPANICADDGRVIPGNSSAFQDDWKTLRDTVHWIQAHAKHNSTTDTPFFVYQGMNIVHPSYRTNDFYYNQIDANKIEIPQWPPLEDLHPCDLQSSMLKGCIPAMDNATARDFFYSKHRRRNIRRIYYAMIAEFDNMVGAYMKAIRQIGEWNNTVFIVTSDHGDLQMEHQQSYKMSPYDASASVPLIIYDGRVDSNNNAYEMKKKETRQRQNTVMDDAPTQLIDLYPTIMELAGVSRTDYPFDMLDGHSLVPLMTDNHDNDHHESLVATVTRPDFVVSQFHGDDIAMSWFLIVRLMPCNPKHYHTDNEYDLESQEQRHLFNKTDTAERMCTMKLVIYGTGLQVDHQLFDVTHDPDEMTNLAFNQRYLPMISSLEQTLRTVVDYPRVALDVARYNQQSMKHWMEVTGDPEWRTAIHAKGLRWDDAFDYDMEGSFRSLEEWVNGEAKVLPCRSDLVWPPP